MTLADVDRQRAEILAIQERMPSPHFKDVCRKALYYLADVKTFESNAGIVSAAIMLYKFHRQTIEDAISKCGYTVVASDDPPRR
jgi:hypothetical protein